MKTKGIDHVIELAETRPDLQVAIYGPILEQDYDFLNTKDYYHGVLEPDTVQTKLSEYDVLLLPTTHLGEGYPGVIIETYQSGLPVIATDWSNLPEIMLHEKTGLLIEPNSFRALESAVDSIDATKYAQLAQHSAHWAAQFDANKINKRIIEEISAL